MKVSCALEMHKTRLTKASEELWALSQQSLTEVNAMGSERDLVAPSVSQRRVSIALHL